MSESNEPTAPSPNAPTDKAAKARAAKAAKKQDRTAALEAQIAELRQMISEKVAPKAALVPEPPASRPGEYFIGGVDPSTGRPILQKRRWRRSDVEREYPMVEFVPQQTVIVSPHGVRPAWRLEQGKPATVPSIVKDIHDSQIVAIQRQSMYKVSETVSKAVFEQALNDPLKGRHFEGLKHVGYGWPMEALTAVSQGRGDDAKAMEEIGWEPEIGFPGGYNGKPLPTK